METILENEKKLYPDAEFASGKWNQEINVRDFIQRNYTPYEGDAKFLAGPTESTQKLWNECLDLFKKERENMGVLDMDTKIVSTVTSHGAGYIDKDLDLLGYLYIDMAVAVAA
jgi:formate C-acetyltransferase